MPLQESNLNERQLMQVTIQPSVPMAVSKLPPAAVPASQAAGGFTVQSEAQVDLSKLVSGKNNLPGEGFEPRVLGRRERFAFNTVLFLGGSAMLARLMAEKAARRFFP